MKKLIVIIFLPLLLSCNQDEENVNIFDDFDSSKMLIDHSPEYSDLCLIYKTINDSVSYDSLKVIIDMTFLGNKGQTYILDSTLTNFHIMNYNYEDSLLYELKDSSINTYTLKKTNILQHY